MGGKAKFSKTMRIDLIPDVPTEAEADRRQRVVIAPASRSRRPRPAAPPSGEDSRYQELLQSIYDAALVSDLDGRIEDVNARAIEFFLYGREELCAMTVFDLISGADESLIHTLCENLEEDRYTLIQAYCVRKNGTLFPCEIAVNRLELGETHLAFFVRDVTLRRQAQEMLRTEHYAIQNAGNGIAVADIEARLEYANPAAARMWGCEKAEDLVGRDVRDLLRDRDAASEMIGSVMGTGQSWTGEMTGLRKDGREFDVQISAVCNRDADGDTVGAVFSFVDMSDRKRAEQALREADRQRVMLESLGAACHYLGQPATVLLANLGVIQKKLDTSDKVVARLVEESIDAVQSLGKILHRLNTVDQYRTTHYLAGSEGPEAEDNRILEI